MIQEKLKYSDYDVLSEEPSRIDNTTDITQEVGLRCPNCGNLLSPISHGKEKKCQCGLKMERWGNALYCRKTSTANPVESWNYTGNLLLLLLILLLLLTIIW